MQSVSASPGTGCASGSVVTWTARVLRTYARLCIASVPAAALSGAACYEIGHTLGQGVVGSLAALLAGGAVLLGIFFLADRKMRIEELNSLVGMVRGRLGR